MFVVSSNILFLLELWNLFHARSVILWCHVLIIQIIQNLCSSNGYVIGIIGSFILENFLIFFPLIIQKMLKFVNFALIERTISI